jgi:hypothetical protein
MGLPRPFVIPLGALVLVTLLAHGARIDANGRRPNVVLASLTIAADRPTAKVEPGRAYQETETMRAT